MKRMYEPIIGIEVHVELNTNSKMFCRCSANYFGAAPNTHTCPVCLGLPGALPYINAQAIEDCLKIGLALNCTIAENSIFERKNYFYPDLPKGYQISQYRYPLCINGHLEIEDENGRRRTIRINRVHQEEDTGKLIHRNADTLVDFNRSGVPLVEIVTEADFHSSVEVKDYAKKLQQIFRYLGVSNADMEKGDMRLEANVSVRKVSNSKSQVPSQLPPYRVELKNINSFRFMQGAIEYEIKRQIEALEKGETLHQETRGWDEDKKLTFLQRSKEEANDYRYFPEPDLPEMRISAQQIDQIKSKMPELPLAKMERFKKEYGLKEIDAKILTDSRQLAEFFEETVKHAKKHQVEIKDIVNYLINKRPDIEKSLPVQIIEQLKGKRVGKITNEAKLEDLAKRAISKNPKSVADYLAGKQAALQALIGEVMKLSLGKADVAVLRPLLEKLLKE